MERMMSSASWEWARMAWTITKDVAFQKLYTRHLPSSPSDLLLNNDNLIGLNIIVTGATNGIGLHTARELAMAGAHVTMACRNKKAAQKIANKWTEEAHNNSKILSVEIMELDLLSLSSVQRFTEEWMQRSKPLHVLINNAGIYNLKDPQIFSDNGIEQHMHVNHIAPAMLTLLLLPSLLQASSSRIINVNSVAHLSATMELESWNNKINEHKFSGLRAYGVSKLAHLMFLKTLADKILDENKEANIQCIAVHPGAVNTKSDNMDLIMKMAQLFCVFEPAQGARSVIYCATSDNVEENLVKGFAYYSYNCKPDRISSQAYDVDACVQVWQKTMEILRLDANYYIRDSFGKD